MDFKMEDNVPQDILEPAKIMELPEKSRKRILDKILIAHQCTLCKEIFTSEKDLYQHIENLQAFVSMYCKVCNSFCSIGDSMQHHHVLYYCEICRLYLNNNNYQDHKCLHQTFLQRNAEKRKVYCNECKQAFFSRTDYKIHLQECQISNKYKYCKCCKMEFESEENLSQHIKSTKECGTKQEEITTSKFQSEFAAKKTLKPHKGKKYECQFCRKVFTYKNDMTLHVKQIHSSDIVTCPFCQKDLPFERLAPHCRWHRVTEKNKNKPRKICDICGFASNFIDRHMRIHGEERRYKCNMCDKSFKLSSCLSKHKLVHSEDARHKCHVCDKAFKNNFNLQVHLRSHEVVKPFPCIVCKKTFTTKQSRDNHLRTHDRKLAKMFSVTHQCSLCKEIFPSQKVLYQHMDNLKAFVSMFCRICNVFYRIGESMQHHTFLFYCEICRLYLDNDNNYQDHKCFHKKSSQRKAEQSKVFCDNCKEALFSKIDLQNHVKECQSLKKYKYCKCCKKEFASKEGFSQHIKSARQCEIKRVKVTGSKPQSELTSVNSLDNHIVKNKNYKSVLKKTGKVKKYECQFCGKIFTYKNDMVLHEKQTHSSDIVTCPICQKELPFRRLGPHSRWHRTREKYKTKPRKVCDICGFASKFIARHMKVHREERRYKCNICDKSFKLSSCLSNHKLVHSDVARHKCHVCDKAFKNNFNLQVHLRSHDVVKPFPCIVCEKTFTTKQSRDNHLKTHDK